MIPSKRLDSSSAIKAAREALEKNGKFLMGNTKIEDEFYNLDLFTREERLMAIDIALQEISPDCRLGPQPPGDISGGKHLYAFFLGLSGIWEKYVFQICRIHRRGADSFVCLLSPRIYR
jgi:hypothetical protein